MFAVRAADNDSITPVPTPQERPAATVGIWIHFPLVDYSAQQYTAAAVRPSGADVGPAEGTVTQRSPATPPTCTVSLIPFPAECGCAC